MAQNVRHFYQTGQIGCLAEPYKSVLPNQPTLHSVWSYQGEEPTNSAIQFNLLIGAIFRTHQEIKWSSISAISIDFFVCLDPTLCSVVQQVTLVRGFIRYSLILPILEIHPEISSEPRFKIQGSITLWHKTSVWMNRQTNKGM